LPSGDVSILATFIAAPAAALPGLFALCRRLSASAQSFWHLPDSVEGIKKIVPLAWPKHGEHRGNLRRGTVEKLPNGKWACFLHLPEVADPINLGKEFKSEEMGEKWLDVSESDTAIDMMIRKHRKQPRQKSVADGGPGRVRFQGPAFCSMPLAVGPHQAPSFAGRSGRSTPGRATGQRGILNVRASDNASDRCRTA